MARPIRETPVLTGRDAARFLKNAQEAKTNKISREEIERMRESVKIFKNVGK